MSEDTTYVTLDLISGKIINEIISPYKNLCPYIA